MPMFFNRRELLRAVAASAAWPPAVGGATRRRTVGIVGGGMAGVALAWLLDGACDVLVLEARDTIGGNVQSLEIERNGTRFVVDMGAQYFHPGPYPAYTALLEQLGLYDSQAIEASPTHPFPASITLTAQGQGLPRFVSPALPDRWWPFLAPWNFLGLWAFGIGFLSAGVREQLNESWNVTLGEWLQTLSLTREQWEGMLLPWAASLFSGNIEQARGMSARAAMVFAAKALPPNPFDPVAYYVLEPGMIAALSRMIAQCSTVSVLTGARVLDASRRPSGGFTLRCDGGRTVGVDELILAASGPATAQLLDGLRGASAQLAAVRGVEFHQARLALHTDPIYAAADTEHRSFLNCHVDGGFCEASMWLRSVVPAAPPATAATLWKSWITHRTRLPRRVLHESWFEHMLPTPATLRAQRRLDTLQGRDGLWFAGGYLHPYDSQETALRSAMRVAFGLNVRSTRSETLMTALDGATL